MNNNFIVGTDIVKHVLCKKDFYFFVQEFWSEIIPEEPVWNWHIKYLCDELETLVKKVAKRQHKENDIVINIPPASSKSTICTIMLPAYCWAIDPTIRIMTVSYSNNLSKDHSTKSRDLIKSEKYKSLFPDVIIRKDIDGKSVYKNTKGGERFATSTTGTATGFHAHLIIVDDPLNPKKAQSKLERETANNFVNSTLATRKIDKNVTPIVLVMQRLHEEDCTGTMLKQRPNEVKHICLPAELSNKVNPIGLRDFYVNGLLDTIRQSKEQLNSLKKSLGSYGYAGQMMQTPAPEEGGIWQKWFIEIEDKEFEKIKLNKIATDWDLAYTKKDSNSASAYVTAGVNDKKMYISDLGFDWLEFPELINLMKKKTQPHYIEGKASGLSAVQSLKKNGIPAISVKLEKGDKVGRTTLATPFAESGLIYIRKSLADKLYNDEKQGILMFPNGTGDDLNDALVQSIIRIFINKSNRVKKSGLL